MPQRSSRPIALTIAGSDSGGGAGIQADLKTFEAHGVHGTTAITSVTAQNPARVRGLRAVSPAFVREQIEAVFEALPPKAAKTGLLGSAAIIRQVSQIWERRPVPLVVDPVMVATSGAELLPPAARTALLRDLFPLATLITPNLPEASALLGQPLHSFEDLRQAAAELHRRFGCSVLLKGGHLKSSRGQPRRGTDVLCHRGQCSVLESAFVSSIKTHGTGCTLSAAIAANLALGLDLPSAVRRAKDYVTRAIAHSYRIGRHHALAHSPPLLEGKP